MRRCHHPPIRNQSTARAGATERLPGCAVLAARRAQLICETWKTKVMQDWLEWRN